MYEGASSHRGYPKTLLPGGGDPLPVPPARRESWTTAAFPISASDMRQSIVPVRESAPTPGVLLSPRHFWDELIKRNFEIRSSAMDVIDNLLRSISVPEGICPVSLSFEHGLDCLHDLFRSHTSKGI